MLFVAPPYPTAKVDVALLPTKVIFSINTLDAYKYKRKSFEHEKEVRIIYQEPYIYELENEKFNINKKKIQSKKGINIEFPLNELIENIYVSPVASDKFFNQVDILCKRYEIKAEIIKSDLYDIDASIY